MIVAGAVSWWHLLLLCLHTLLLTMLLVLASMNLHVHQGNLACRGTSILQPLLFSHHALCWESLPIQPPCKCHVLHHLLTCVWCSLLAAPASPSQPMLQSDAACQPCSATHAAKATLANRIGTAASRSCCSSRQCGILLRPSTAYIQGTTVTCS